MTIAVTPDFLGALQLATLKKERATLPKEHRFNSLSDKEFLGVIRMVLTKDFVEWLISEKPELMKQFMRDISTWTEDRQ